VFGLGLGQGFFKENVRYLVWICRDPISLILGTRFALNASKLRECFLCINKNNWKLRIWQDWDCWSD